MTATIHIGNRRHPEAHQCPTYYVGRPSPLGNPYAVGRDGTREEVIAKYAAWLDDQLAIDPPAPASRQLARLLAAARRHEAILLTCWCAPERCHAEVIRDLIRDLLDPDARRREDERVFWEETLG